MTFSNPATKRKGKREVVSGLVCSLLGERCLSLSLFPLVCVTCGDVHFSVPLLLKKESFQDEKEKESENMTRYTDPQMCVPCLSYLCPCRNRRFFRSQEFCCFLDTCEGGSSLPFSFLCVHSENLGERKEASFVPQMRKGTTEKGEKMASCILTSN